MRAGRRRHRPQEGVTLTHTKTTLTQTLTLALTLILTLALTLTLTLALTLTLTLTRCEDQCNMGLDSGVASCPVQSCVCDWDGTWPSDDDEGFAGWDLGNLGIGGQHRKDYVASLL